MGLPFSPLGIVQTIGHNDGNQFEGLTAQKPEGKVATDKRYTKCTRKLPLVTGGRNTTISYRLSSVHKAQSKTEASA